MKSYFLGVAVLLMLLYIPCFPQIGAKTSQGKIYGTWTNNEFGFQMTLILNADGSGEFDGEAMKFTVQGDKLTLVQDGMTNVYTYTHQGNKLTVAGGDLEKALTFTRLGSSEGNTSQTTAGAQTNTTAKPSEAKAILGVWSGYNETIEFKANGECNYRGQVFPYEVSGNYIALQTSQGNVMMAYHVTANSLNLTVNNQNFTYTKNGSTGNAATGKSSSRNIDPTLVGKWCYVNVYATNSGGSSTSQCITLYENGTYEYYSESSRSVNTSTLSGGTASQDSDQGTWWVEGNRIHYNSQTQGQGSYELEKRNHPKNNDPMIVLDGNSYVTFYNKQPW